MLWQYIIENYSPGEPIIAIDIDLNISEVNRRQKFKMLTDEGKLRRYENGIYYIPKKSLLGSEVSPLPESIIESKYISRNQRVFGYYSGYTFANQIGITTQVPFVQEIVTNEIGNPIKYIEKGNRSFVLRKSQTVITEENADVLQFLDLLKDIDKYTELRGQELTKNLSQYIEKCGITKSKIDKYLSLYPERIYKSIYETGIIHVLA